MPLTLKTFVLGQWMTNCYVLHPAHAQPGSPCWIIDAGFSPGPLLAYLQQHQLKPLQVILTHAHLDHIAGLHEVRGAYPQIPILIHEAERDFLASPELNLSEFVDEPIVAPEATGFLAHGQTLELEGRRFEIRHTPGHSPGGITLYQKEQNLALVGDTLFQASIGRYDFPTSDGPTLITSIRTQLLTLPDNTQILPGHGPPSTIGLERAHNPYLMEAEM